MRGAAFWARADDHHYPGTYRAGCYDRLVSRVNGEDVENESLVNLPNWLPLTFRARGDAHWFSLQAVDLLSYRHSLDLETGITLRDLVIRDAQGRRTAVRERRLVSMAQPHLAALLVEIEPQDWSGALEIRSGIHTGVTNDAVERYRPYESRHLDLLAQLRLEPGLLLAQARTRQTRIEIAVATRTRLVGGAFSSSMADEEQGSEIAETVTCTAAPGIALAVEKVAAIFTSRDPAMSEPATAAAAASRDAPSFDALATAHRRAWARAWSGCRPQTKDAEATRTLELHAFHLLQTVSPHSTELDVGLPPRGWQEAYHGQIFWDELLAFPFLNTRRPELARSLLLYRYRRLDAARRAAREAGLRGAMYPWRSASTGREETPSFQLNLLSGRWMRDDTELQRHIGSAIALNVWRYFEATGDLEFLAKHGAEMMIEIARFWASLARPDPVSGRYDIAGVVGPDEYHTAYPGAADPGLRTNAYTNVVAAWTLQHAAEALDYLPARRRQALWHWLQLDETELGLWDRIGRRLRLAFHDDGIVSQFAGFDRLMPFDLDDFAARHPGQRVDWVLELNGESTNDYRVTRQPDVLMLLYLLGDDGMIRTASRMGYALALDQLRRTVDYYLACTVHDSSLSRVVCAGALARLDPAASWRFYEEALRPSSASSNASRSKEGVPLGAMAGTLDVLQRHYMGLDLSCEGIIVQPAIPSQLESARLSFRYRGGEFELELKENILHLRSGLGSAAPVGVTHRGRRLIMPPGGSLTLQLDGRTKPRASSAASGA